MSKTKEFLEKAFDEAERKDILSRSRYYVDKDTDYSFSPADVLEAGKLPDLANKAEEVRCTMEVLQFVRKSTTSRPELLEIDDYVEQVRTFLKSLPVDLLTMFVGGATLRMTEFIVAQDEELGSKVTGVVTDANR